MEGNDAIVNLITDNMNIYRPISEIMTTDLTTVRPNTMMSAVAEIFDKHHFHHIPVIDESYLPVGILSRHDYNQLQHHFTKTGCEVADVNNKRLFDSLTVSDVMTRNPVTLEKDESMYDVIEIFLANRFHSILVTDAGLCVGIVTPYDILSEMKKLAVVLQ